MKPFDLKAAKEGAPVMTMHGHRAKILCFDKKGELPVVATIDFEDHEMVYDYFEDGTMPHFAPLRLTLMMRDDDYAEKLARGEYGPTVKENLTVDAPTCNVSIQVDREYWRRVYAGQIMPVVFHAAITTGAKVKAEYKDMPAVVAIARSTITLADALLAELEKKEIDG